MLDPNYAEPLFQLGQVLLGEGRRRAAAARLQEAVTLAIISAESAGENAVDQAGNHRCSRARQLLLKAREQQQLAAEAAFSLARLHQSAGRHSAAEEMLATATVCDPDHAEAHYLLGRVRQQQGDLSEARRLMELCVGSNYAHGAAHIGLAQVITAEDEAHLARNHYFTALDMDATLATEELEERFAI